MQSYEVRFAHAKALLPVDQWYAFPNTWDMQLQLVNSILVISCRVMGQPILFTTPLLCRGRKCPNKSAGVLFSGMFP